MTLGDLLAVACGETTLEAAEQRAVAEELADRRIEAAINEYGGCFGLDGACCLWRGHRDADGPWGSDWPECVRADDLFTRSTTP